MRPGDPDVLVYNAGYLEGRDLPPEMELMENIPFEMYETAQHIASSGSLPGSQGGAALHAREGPGAPSSFPTTTSPCGAASGYTGQSLYYPRVLMRGVRPGADRGVLRARRPRRQRGHRRHDRFSGNTGHGPCPAES